MSPLEQVSVLIVFQLQSSNTFGFTPIPVRPINPGAVQLKILNPTSGNFVSKSAVLNLT